MTWSSGLSTGVKSNVSMKNLIGRGSGETFTMSFSGKGWVLVQPSEGRVAAPSQAGGAGGGAATTTPAPAPTPAPTEPAAPAPTEPAAAVHSLTGGTDAGNPVVGGAMVGAVALVAVLTLMRIARAAGRSRAREAAAPPPRPAATRQPA